MITSSTALAFLFYCFIQGITPGPANVVSFGTSMAFGTRSAIRQWAGLVVGYLIISAVSLVLLLALGSIADRALQIVSYAGAAYVTYLAIHTLRASSKTDQASLPTPTFSSGLAVQLTNAKIAVACIAAFSSYVIPFTQDPFALVLAALAMPLIGTACNLVWLFGGNLLSETYARHEKVANAIMAVSLLLCAASMLLI